MVGGVFYALFASNFIAWIDSLESGSQFRSWTVILLKILGLVVLVGISVWSIVICVDTIGASKNLGMTPSILVVIGSILEVCITITITTISAMLCWNRSNKIRTLDNDPNFLLISIAVIGVQLLGEVSFLVPIGTGVQTLVASIFGSGIPKFLDTFLWNRELLGLFPIAPRGNITFTSSMILSVIFALSGPALLITAYLIAEEINVFANIAESLNHIETKLVTEETAPDT